MRNYFSWLPAFRKPNEERRGGEARGEADAHLNQSPHRMHADGPGFDKWGLRPREKVYYLLPVKHSLRLTRTRYPGDKGTQTVTLMHREKAGCEHLPLQLAVELYYLRAHSFPDVDADPVNREEGNPTTQTMSTQTSGWRVQSLRRKGSTKKKKKES